MTAPVRLTLPLPPSPNAWARHPMVLHREKKAYQREAWAAAVQQALPKVAEELPARSEVFATLRLTHLRDEDNASASVKWALDALRQHQTGDLDWRGGIAWNKGYFIDDDPARLSVAKPVQERVRKKADVALVLEIRPAATETEAQG